VQAGFALHVTLTGQAMAGLVVEGGIKQATGPVGNPQNIKNRKFIKK
jgi:hypothetical protein